MLVRIEEALMDGGLVDYMSSESKRWERNEFVISLGRAKKVKRPCGVSFDTTYYCTKLQYRVLQSQ